jgi:hypothetical protein
MGLFSLHFDDSLYVILITCFLWAINFRATFKNNSDSMGLGSCWVLRFDPILILIKNIICIFYFIVFCYELKLSRSYKSAEQIYVKKQEGSHIKIELTELKPNEENLINTVNVANKLDKTEVKIWFWIKNFLLILVTYIIEELYFLLSNNHVLDRVICPIRNFGILLALFIFSPLFLKKACSYNKHQIIPFIIIFILSILIILFNIFGVDRFLKKFKPVNSSIYYTTYFLIGLEIVIIKRLVDYEFLSIFLILGIKGLIGTIIFTGINIAYTPRQFFDFLDSILTFEYDDMLDDFEVIYKIIYVVTLVILEWLKIYVINKYSENHLQMILMMVDLIYFPFYCIERFPIQGFTIFRFDSFIYNVIIGVLNTFFMLIFNEILECKFWGLDKGLKRNINKRKDIIIDPNIDILSDGRSSDATNQRNSNNNNNENRD